MAVDSPCGNIIVSSPPSTGIMVASGPIDDFAGCKTCHQCRQKIRNLLAECKNQRNKKPCALKICQKCLLNRYGEKVEEVAVLQEWSCPKCRGICNCSVCMKRSGHQPTGILINAAKANGFSSVSEMLVKGAACMNHENFGTATIDSPKEGIVISPRKRGKENSFDGKSDANLQHSVEKSSKKVKEAQNGFVDDNIPSKTVNLGHKREREEAGFVDIHDLTESMKNRAAISKKNFAPTLEEENRKKIADIPLPVGTELTSVAGIDISAEDVGDALQFLEFCSVFRKILGVKKGQPEQVLQDLFHRRTTRQGKFSLSVQFHIQLLSAIQNGNGQRRAELSAKREKSSWFRTLKKCLSKSKSILQAKVLDSLESEIDYENLCASEKLRILNILCDEIVGTEKVRNWINDQNKKFTEKAKEAKQKVCAAKLEEKSLKQKAKIDIPNANIPKDGDSPPISEKEEATLDKPGETQSDANVIGSEDILLRDKRTSDAIRIEPVFVDYRGHAYWKLNCVGNSDILDQNIGKGDGLTSDEKWFALDAHGKEVIEKYVSLLK